VLCDGFLWSGCGELCGNRGLLDVGFSDLKIRQLSQVYFLEGIVRRVSS
jgi:hypothetical protein